mgnify:CR=1 FL=1|jgi:hypothetical protein|tara:strand:- start:430 stop:732 length:303 start_codon:yes stop_codon:yes gene_type:complete
MTLFNMKFKQTGDNSFQAINTAGGLLYIDYQAYGYCICYATSGLHADLCKYEDVFATFEEAAKKAETLVAISLTFDGSEPASDKPIVIKPSSTVLRPATA